MNNNYTDKYAAHGHREHQHQSDNIIRTDASHASPESYYANSVEDQQNQSPPVNIHYDMPPVHKPVASTTTSAGTHGILGLINGAHNK